MVIFSLICLGLEVNPRFMKLAIIRPLKLLRSVVCRIEITSTKYEIIALSLSLSG